MNRIIVVKIKLFIAISLAFCVAIHPVSVLAQDGTLSDEQSRIGNGIYYYNPNDEGSSTTGACTTTGTTSSNLGNVPDPWRSLISKTAGEYPTVDMRLVAATLWIENRGWPDYDKEWAVSGAGAKGPWQFIDSTWNGTSTWPGMGTDGDGDGVKDPNNPLDAVHAAFKHQVGSSGKPIIVGYNNDVQAGLSLTFERKDTNLLYYLAKYNGSGAPDGVALKDFPDKENANYVKFGYYLLATDFTETWDEADGSRNIAQDGIQSGGSADACGSSETGIVSSDGFSFPLGLEKSKIDYLPCNKATCHHDGSPAADMFAPLGTSVFAIEDGTISSVDDGYDDIPGCYSINFTGKSGWKYWLGHIKSPTVSANQPVKAGQKIALVGEKKCAKGTPEHLHIDRGGPEKGKAGGYDCCRSPTLIPLLNTLFEELPG